MGNGVGECTKARNLTPYHALAPLTVWGSPHTTGTHLRPLLGRPTRLAVWGPLHSAPDRDKRIRWLDDATPYALL